MSAHDTVCTMLDLMTDVNNKFCFKVNAGQLIFFYCFWLTLPIIKTYLMQKNVSFCKILVKVLFSAGSRIAVLLNNLGSTSELEMNILMMETMEYWGKYAITCVHLCDINRCPHTVH